MSLNNLKIVEVIAQQHSFAKAAALLNMTPSAVSHAVRNVEEEFNLQLFVRSRRGASLTREGARLIPYIHSVQQSNELLYLEVEQIHGLTSGTVRLATFNSVTIRWLPQILKSFHQEYPTIEIQIQQGSYDDIEGWLRTETADLAFMVGENAPDNVDVIPLHKDQLLCVTPQDYVPPHEHYVTPEDISGMNLILQQDGYNKEVVDFLEQNHIRIKSSFYVESDEAIVALVMTGMGYCILSEMISLSPEAEVRVYPIHPESYRIISLAALRHSFPAPASIKLREKILDFMETNGLRNI